MRRFFQESSDSFGWLILTREPARSDNETAAELPPTADFP